MAKTERRVEDVVGDGEEMADALSAVLDVADEQGTVSWGDVSDDLSSGEWGRLIESGLLVDAGGDGFVLDDPEGVREALSDAEPDESAENDLSWSRRDKLAGVGVLLLFLAYSQQGLRDVIAGDGINLVLGPLNATLPFHVIILILALATGLWTSILQDSMMDTSIMSDYQETQKNFKEKIEEAKERDDDERVQELRQEQM